VTGVELVEMRTPEVCCGFGGTFCVKYPAISNAMATDKTADISASGADTVLAGDLGCLLNMAGKLQREGRPVRRPARGRSARRHDRSRRDRRAGGTVAGAWLMQSTAHAFKQNVCRRTARPRPATVAGDLKAASQERRRLAAERLPEFDALRAQARDIKDHALAHLDLYLERFEAKVQAMGGHVHWAPTPADARESCSTSAAATARARWRSPSR
jgi:hypothetical protein